MATFAPPTRVIVTPPVDEQSAPGAPPVSDGTSGGSSVEEPGQRIDLRAIWTMLRRNMWLILAATLGALALGLVVTVLSTPQYRATASVQIDQQADRVLQTEDRDQNGSSSQDADRFLRTQTDVLRSRSLAIGVAQSLKLFGSQRFYDAMGSAPALAGQGAITERANREKTLELLLGRLDINLPGNSRVAAITFESADAQLSADIANAYAKNFIVNNLQRKYNSSSYARDFLASQLVEAKAKLEQSEQQLNRYARAAGLIAARNLPSRAGGETTTTTQSVTNASLVQLNEASNLATANRIAAEQKWRSASGVSVMTIPEVLANPAVQALLEQRAVKTLALREERARHRDEYPAVRELQAQVTEIESQVAALAGNIRDSIRGQYQAAERQEQALVGQVSGLKEATLGEQDRSVQFNILSREVDTNRTLYDGLLQRFKEVSAAAGVSTNNISVVDTADTPLSPSSPKLLVNLAVALLVGLVLSASIVYLREEIDDAVRSPADIERKLGLTVLGTIPRVPEGEDVLGALAQPLAPVTEAYAALRTSLIYSSAQGLPQSLLITSTQPGEGKSTSSFAVAVALAKLGNRVLLVDADLRRPSLHDLLGIRNTVGLSDLLVQRGTIEGTLVALPDFGITLLPSGPIPPNPTDVLGGGTLPALIERLVGGFDIVVLDGPPVLGLADAPLLAAQVEATMLVVESNRGYGGRTKGAIRRLRSANAVVIGAVLTKFEARKSGVGYEYGYEYYNYSASPQKLPERGRR